MTSPKPALRRSLRLLETTLGGVGIILGAGIYALVGEVAGEAGNALWSSFLIAAFMAVLVGLCYAELASAYPRAGADYEYTRRALGLRAAFVVGWLIVIGNLVAAATVSLGLAGYLHGYIDVEPRILAIAALVLGTVIAYRGIRAAVWTAVILTIAEAAGLLFIIAIGVPHFGDNDLLETNSGLSGIFGGAALVMFAFIGFEQIATLSEETVDAPRVVPRALLLSIAAAAFLYVSVAVAAVSVVGWEALSVSSAPLALVAEQVLGDRASDFVSVIALFSTGNTILLLLVAASRLIYGMAQTDALPRFLAWVDPQRQTPARAILLSLVVAVGFALSGDIGLVAGATNFAVFIGFAAVCASLIILRFRDPDVPRPFKLPFSIGRVPLVPILGLASVGFMMAHLEWKVLIIGGGLFLSGIVAMEIFSLWRPSKQGAPDLT